MVVTRLRNIFIGIGLLMLAVFLLSLFFERTYLVKREVTIAAAPAKVFPLINTPALWDEWMSWGAPDSSYTYIFMGPPSGRFAKKIMKGPQGDIVFKNIYNELIAFKQFILQLIRLTYFMQFSLMFYISFSNCKQFNL